MALMVDKGCRHFPMPDRGKLAGVLSMPALVKVAVEQQQFTATRLLK